MKTLLIDADPLSDIATLLDITSPEESLGMGRESEAHEVFKLLDLLSLGRRRNPRQAGALLSQLMGPGENICGGGIESSWWTFPRDFWRRRVGGSLTK